MQWSELLPLLISFWVACALYICLYCLHLGQATSLAMFIYVHKVKFNSIKKWALNSKISVEGSHSNCILKDPHNYTETTVLPGISTSNTSEKTKCWKKEDRNGNDTQQTEEPRPWFLMKKECRKITASLNVAQLQSWSRKRGQEQGRNKRGK